jgi:hypothetical protein
MTPPIRPIQFSTLKALNPLQNEEEDAEHCQRQDHITQVRHLGNSYLMNVLYGAAACRRQPMLRSTIKKPLNSLVKGPLRDACARLR